MSQATKYALAWITGAGTGIGLAIAKALADKGVTVIISGRTQKTLDEACMAYNSNGEYNRLHAMVCDVTDATQVQQTWHSICERWGIPDLILLNAGNHITVDVNHFSASTFENLMSVNFMGVVNCLDALLPTLIKRGQGQIGVVASLAGYRGLPTAAAYGASKAALINLCESIYMDLQQKGIQLSLINPGFVKTPLTDKNDFTMPFLIPADEAAEVVLKKLQRQTFEIAFPWVFSRLMNVLRCLPYKLYFYLIKRLPQEKRESK